MLRALNEVGGGVLRDVGYAAIISWGRPYEILAGLLAGPSFFSFGYGSESC